MKTRHHGKAERPPAGQESPNSSSSEDQQEKRVRTAKNSFWFALATTLAIAVALLALKERVEKTKYGMLFEQMSYDLLQYRLKPETNVPLLVVDISSIPMVSSNGLKPRLVTDRRQLQSVVDVLTEDSEKAPRAIGLDVDFSPDQYGYADPDDWRFLNFLLKKRKETNIPIFVGVNDSLALGPTNWLKEPIYMPLAACVVVPFPEPGQSTRSMPEWLQGEYHGDYLTVTTNRCYSMGAELASAKPDPRASEKTDSLACVKPDPHIFVNPDVPASEMPVDLAPASLERDVPASVKPVPSWLRFAIISSTMRNGQRLTESQFLVDFSALEILSNCRLQDPADSALEVKDKIVILGRTDQTNDTFTVPGRPEKPYPGVFLHASAAYTLLRGNPLYRLTDSSRRIMDLLFAVIIFGAVTAIRVFRTRKNVGDFNENSYTRVISFLFALAVVVGTPFLVRIFHVMWDDFILVSIALVAHPLIERKIDELDDRIRQRSPSSDQSRTKAKE